MIKSRIYSMADFCFNFNFTHVHEVYTSEQWVKSGLIDMDEELLRDVYGHPIHDIIFNIRNNQIEYHTVFRKFECDEIPIEYDLYEILLPFREVCSQNIIGLLKIFVKYGDTISSMSYMEPNNTDIGSCTKISCLNMVFTITKATIHQEMVSAFVHELKYTFSFISKKLASAISDDNDKVQKLEELKLSLNSQIEKSYYIPTVYRSYYEDNVVSALLQLQYFCQECEIISYLDFATYEIQYLLQNFKIDKDKILMLIQVPALMNKYSDYLKVVECYRILNNACNVLDDQMFWHYYKQTCPDTFNKLVEILFNKDGDPMAYIDFCKKQVRQFLKKLADIVLSF